MYENFFEMKHTPFTRDIPTKQLYESPYVQMQLDGLLMPPIASCLQLSLLTPDVENQL